MRVGPFELRDVIGRGGMGEVWSAEQVDTGLPVAVKFDLHEPTEALRHAFFHEVRLVAGLSHPNCVQVVDAGVTTAQDVASSAGKLQLGAPWLAMEWARGGALSRKHGPQSWEEIRHVLRGLLEALRHAHSRGVLHRDIKYGNLLLAGNLGDLTMRPGSLLEARIVLSDFGIGHLLSENTSGGDHAAGTPSYMAPEQILGEWRKQGPWTDFYATGVLAWSMACRAYPFSYPSSFHTLQAHLTKKPGEFQPVVPVPEGYEALCRRLLKKRPANRFQFASQVLEVLEGLGEAEGRANTALAVEEDAPTQVASTASRTSAPAAADSTISLGLWGLKPLPLVGREAEERRLQAAVRRVRDSGQAGALVLEGAAGVGKSRLLQWLAQWAHEEGLAETLTGFHTPLREPGDGLLAMVARHLRLEGLEPHELEERVSDLLGTSPFADALIRALEGKRLSRTALHQMLAFVLRNAIPGSVRIVLVEDVQWGLESLVAVDAILEDQQAHPAPVLFVLTARSEALQDRPVERLLLDEIKEERKLVTMQLGPLAPEAHRSLVRSLLGLEGALAETVERRTAGNPLFAVQWVGHWVDQGKLVRGPRGLRLAEPGQPAIPGDLVSVWAERLDGVLASRPANDGPALELAAVLGHQVELEEWRLACDHAGLKPSADLLPELLRRRLLISADDRLGERVGFAHGLMVEALALRSRAGGRWEDLNRSAAHALTNRSPDPDRLARLWLEAGATSLAIDPLAEACEAQLMAYDMRSDARIQALEDALNTVDPSQSDPRWVRLWIVQSWIARLRGDLAAAKGTAGAAVDRSVRGTLQPMHFEALKELGLVALALGELEEALAHLGRAGELARAVDRAEFAAYCQLQQADALLFLGRLDEAAAKFAEIEDLFEGTHLEILSHEPVLGLANAAIRSGRHSEAVQHLQKARKRASRARLPGVLAQIANLQGEVARYTGDLDAAVECYDEASRRYRELDHTHFVWPALNLGLVLFEQGRALEARARMGVLAQQTGELMPVGEACARFVAYACDCALGDWEVADEGALWLSDFLDKVPLAEPDLVKLATAAAESCRAAGQPAREVCALALLVGQLDRLGRTEEAAGTRARLSELS